MNFFNKANISRVRFVRLHKRKRKMNGYDAIDFPFNVGGATHKFDGMKKMNLLTICVKMHHISSLEFISNSVYSVVPSFNVFK